MKKVIISSLLAFGLMTGYSFAQSDKPTPPSKDNQPAKVAADKAPAAADAAAKNQKTDFKKGPKDFQKNPNFQPGQHGQRHKNFDKSRNPNNDWGKRGGRNDRGPAPFGPNSCPCCKGQQQQQFACPCHNGASFKGHQGPQQGFHRGPQFNGPKDFHRGPQFNGPKDSHRGPRPDGMQNFRQAPRPMFFFNECVNDKKEIEIDKVVKFLKEIDKDANGSLSKEEFEAFGKKKMEERKKMMEEKRAKNSAEKTKAAPQAPAPKAEKK